MFKRVACAIAALSLSLVAIGSPPTEALVLPQQDILGPAGSHAFGGRIQFLANNNLVVSDPLFDAGGTLEVGAVRVYSPTGALLNTITGSAANDQVGSGGIRELANGSFLIISGLWSANRGAVTLCPAAGCSGQVSAANSLVGSTPGDSVGGLGGFFTSVQLLANNAYVVPSPAWDNGSVVDAGAVTWCSAAGCVGAVSVVNSLVGSTLNDRVGNGGAQSFASGAFVVTSTGWDNTGAADAGAVTWCPATGCAPGAVSAANSLVGSTAGDFVGSVRTFASGAFVVQSFVWDNTAPVAVNAGAVTWCAGAAATPCVGPVSASYSLVGSTAGDFVGGISTFPSGAFVAVSSNWDNAGVANVGAVTWCAGAAATPCVGAVSASNSLVGSQPNDSVGSGFVATLAGGAFVALSPDWDNVGVANAGAVTWCGPTGCPNVVVSATNSLVGSTAEDNVGGNFVETFASGAFVVPSPNWDNTAAAAVDAGAVTWCPATGCVPGAVSTLNSLVGSTLDDRVGGNFVETFASGAFAVPTPTWDNGAVADAGAVTSCSAAGCVGAVSVGNSLVGSHTNDRVGELTNQLFVNDNLVVGSPGWNGTVGAATFCPTTGCTPGVVSATNSLVGSTAGDAVGSDLASSGGRYAVISSSWANGAAAQAGAVTWCAATGCVGAVSAANSLVGTTANDHVGSFGVRELVTGGPVVIDSPDWANGAAAQAGAVTWCVPATCFGPVSTSNSLVGSTANDRVGSGFVDVLSNGDYVVISRTWDNGAVVNAGAVTVGSGATGEFGPVTATNSVAGRAADSGLSLITDRSVDESLLAIGFQVENRVVLGALPSNDYTPLVPARLLDTRPAGPGIATIDGLFLSGGVVPGGTTLELQVGGRGGVAANAEAVVLNVTVTEASQDGFLTVFPCGVPIPTASNLNYVAGGTVPNAVLTKLGTGGKVCLYAQRTTHLIVDVNGEFPATSTYVPLVPARLLDTRPAGPGIATIDSLFLSGGVVTGGTTLELQVGGRGGVPLTAKAAALNVTVTEASQDGFLTVFPCGVPIPTASNLNYVAGGTVPNAVISKLGTDGKVCLFAQRTTHLIVDVNGEFPSNSRYLPLVPARLLDTRAAGPGIATIDGQFLSGGVVAGGTTLQLQITGRGGVPADAKAVVLNVTVTEATLDGFLTVFPCGVPIPTASNLNYGLGGTVPNAVISKVGTGGTVCLYAQRTTHLIVDVNGVM